MDIEENIIKQIYKNIKTCPHCLGTGKLKAMQNVATYTGSVRGKDTKVKCKFCNGTGLIIS